MKYWFLHRHFFNEPIQWGGSASIGFSKSQMPEKSFQVMPSDYKICKREYFLKWFYSLAKMIHTPSFGKCKLLCLIGTAGNPEDYGTHLKALIHMWLLGMEMKMGMASSRGLPHPLYWKSNSLTEIGIALSRTKKFQFSFWILFTTEQGFQMRFINSL